MSTTNAPAYCEIDDVQDALQEADAKMGDAALQDKFVEPAIFAASRWLKGASNGHWYDSNAAASDLISTSTATKTKIIRDVPASPHEQRGQLFFSNDESGPHHYVRTYQGPYTRVKLPAMWVDSVDALRVRDSAGEQEDWVSTKSSGRGNAYFTTTEGGILGTTYLYLDAGQLPNLVRYDEVVDVDVSYGLDWNDEPWDDVRRGVAVIAAAQLIAEDNVIAQVPESANLVGVETEVDILLNQAFTEPGYLSQYVPTHPVA